MKINLIFFNNIYLFIIQEEWEVETTEKVRNKYIIYKQFEQLFFIQPPEVKHNTKN